MKKIAGLVFLVLSFTQGVAQFIFRPDYSIPVSDLDGIQKSPWIGGINAGQFNTLDLNSDGKEDLVVYDRTTGRILTYLNNNNSWAYAPEFESAFPAIENWVLLRDYNCDGRKDLFTGDPLGIKVYQNTADGNKISWKKVLFNTGFVGEPKSEVLLTKGFSTLVNLQLQFDDLPDISDADGDGDLDIFNMKFVGNGTIEYHRNYSMERYGTCDSLAFERITQNYGNFVECTCGEFAFNDEPCIFSGRINHAGGKSLLVVDVTNDGVKDILFAEATCSKLSLLVNQGTLENPVFTNAVAFPSINPINFPLYPSVYYEDMNFDGEKDLIAAPNLFSRSNFNVNFMESVWLYSQQNGSFEFVQPDFLQKDMIDLGDNALPAFADVDGDSDFDLIVATSKVPATLYLYKNTGTPSSPVFQLENTDYLGFNSGQFYNLKIRVADFDGNNTQDLILSAISFLDGSNQLYYIPNSSTIEFDFSSASIQPLGIFLSGNENFSLIDVDLDGNPDVLIGKANGSVDYLRKNGAFPIQFEAATTGWLGFTSTVTRQNVSFSSGDLNADGQEDLVVGDQSGVLGIISNFRNAVASDIIKDLIQVDESEVGTLLNLGGRIWPMVVNLRNETKPDLVVGTLGGGLRYLKNSGGSELPENPTLEVFPNPLNDPWDVKLRSDRQVNISVYSATGAMLISEFTIAGNTIVNVNLSELSAGLYIIKARQNNQTTFKRLILLR